MIYVSSSCVKNKYIKDSVLELHNVGFKNIELSGGTEIYDNLESDLIELQEKYSINYMCHNYFPPPKEHFVLNLASLDDRVYNNSIEHLIKAINLSKKLGSKKFAFHAGFFLDIKVSELGKAITLSDTYDYDKSNLRFIEGYNLLTKEAEDLKLYVENNVYSFKNFETFNGKKAFMLTNSNDYFELKNQLDFNIMLDVAHLKVSANSQNLDYYDELSKLKSETDYFHLSDNNGLADENKSITDQYLINFLDINGNNTYTLETYIDTSDIKLNFDIINDSKWQ